MISVIKAGSFFYKKLTALQNEKTPVLTPVEEMLACEIPVALVYNGIAHTVMMCSPQDLEDFALGFSLTEGIIEHPNEIYGVDIVEVCHGIEVQIELATRCFVKLKERRRTLTGRTGCGICGSEQLDQVTRNLPILDRTLQVNLDKLNACLQKLQAAQVLGKQVGSTHAAAFFDPQGQLLAIREDVGRHVALDKLLGWHARHGKPQGFVYVTSRAGYEMVQKTVGCGIEMLAAISAATDFAVNMAAKHQLTLLGFARQDKATVYCGKERLIF